MATKFQLPTEFHKDITEGSIKVYKSKLNKLAALGFDTPHLLKTQPKKVIDAIKDLPKSEQRALLAPIGWVCNLPDENAYKTYVMTHVNPKPEGGWPKKA